MSRSTVLRDLLIGKSDRECGEWGVVGGVLLNTIVMFHEISATGSVFFGVLPDCAGHKHPPVQQHVRNISLQS